MINAKKIMLKENMEFVKLKIAINGQMEFVKFVNLSSS